MSGPLLIDSALIRGLHLGSEDKKIRHRNVGRYIGAEMTERGWLVEIAQIANSARQWRELFGNEIPDDL